MAALVALVSLAKLDAAFGSSGYQLSSMLGACMELVVERRALRVKDSLFPTFCLDCLKAWHSAIANGKPP